MKAPRYLLDTNVIVQWKRGRADGLSRKLEGLQVGAVAVSVVTVGELLYGVAKSPDPDRSRATLERVLMDLTVLPMNEAAAAAYSRIRWDLASRGELIGNNDLWIAAHALAEKLTLVTNNTREFERVRGLVVEDWQGE